MIDQLMQFSVDSTEKRRLYIKQHLEDHNIEYTEQLVKEQDVTNIIVKINQDNEDQKVTMVGAHYDVFPGSKGINDNGCAVIAMIEMIKKARDSMTDKPLEFVFFDREETGMIGSYEYLKENHKRISFAIVLDIICFGDKLVYGTYNENVHSILSGIRDLHRINQVLISDNCSFNRFEVPNALITAAPDSDLRERKDGTYRLALAPEFYSSFHNRVNDNKVEVLNFKLMDKAINAIGSLF